MALWWGGEKVKIWRFGGAVKIVLNINLWSTFRVKYQFAHLHKIRKIITAYVLMLTDLLESRRRMKSVSAEQNYFKK